MSFPFSLQTKAAAVLLIVVVSAALLGGLISNHLLSEWVAQTQTDHAERMAEMLRISVAGQLARHETQAVTNTANEFLRHDTVLAVAVRDADGEYITGAVKRGLGPETLPMGSEPVSLAYTRSEGDDRLQIARPVRSTTGSDGAIAGSVRIVLDTSAATERLQKAQLVMGLMICGFVVGFVPLGHILVSRVLIGPIKRLAEATGQLAQGNYRARADHRSGDEVGALARSFNTMAKKIDQQHQMLIDANEGLESQVSERTAALDRANTQLRAEMDDHQQFVRAVSHDLSAPLRNIGGMVAMMMMKWGDQLPQEVRSRLERVQANVAAETELINDLLELSRIGARPSHSERVDVADLLEQVAASFEFDLRQGKITFVVGDAMPVLHIDRNYIRQVFMNLVDNAVKYMNRPKGGRIEITHDADEHDHVFHVADNGMGIADEDLQRVFVVFRRAANASPDTPGKGIGLAGVSAIAAKYEGRAWVDSEPDVGSVFHVSLSRKLCELPPEDEYLNDQPSEHNAPVCHSVG